jgi:hypothetical protein
MRTFRKWLIAGSAPLAALPLLLDRPAAVAAEDDVARESVSVSPVSLTEITARGKGDIDNRPVRLDNAGLMEVGPGDLIEVNLKVPDGLVGKRGFLDLQYKIREERDGGFCKKEVIHHPRTQPVEFASELQVGTQIHVDVILQSLAPGSGTVTYHLKAGHNEPIRVQAGARVLVKFHMQPEDVEFTGRQNLTQAEWDRYVGPELEQLRRIPNVELPEPVVNNVDVQSGNVSELTVDLKARRARR